ncbi:MAG: aminodeoxychorismate synthase component I [Candidatus Omnitrophica bacterium]|nr:aminodeoxychorismate synthase component I [Candidatus Omnitrophota bacterium]
MAYYIWKSYKLEFDPAVLWQNFVDYEGAFFLDSSLQLQNTGRYSFFGIEPFLKLSISGSTPFQKLAAAFKNYYLPAIPGAPPFIGGAVGYLAYDLGVRLEGKIKPREKTALAVPECLFHFYNTVIIIDHLKKVFFICATGFPEKSSALAKTLAESNFRRISKIILESGKLQKHEKSIQKENQIFRLESNFTKENYLRAVRKAKEYIKAGDIYQVNLSQRFQSKTDLSSLEIYRRLRKANPASFSAYFDAGDFQILSSSPERFLQLTSDRVITRPMKGTRGRSPNKKRDACLRKELLDSVKDQAELIMIVDLERNDLGKVCDYDTIKVTKLRQLEEYRTVYQTTATIEGRLFKGSNRFDLLRACFPGGSITGCPKIRAMEIIDELEPDKRAIYTGALGYLSFCGKMDFNIMIRTILKKGKELYFGVGGGIVADSDPLEEYQETLVKGRGMVEAINGT